MLTRHARIPLSTVVVPLRQVGLPALLMLTKLLNNPRSRINKLDLSGHDIPIQSMSDSELFKAVGSRHKASLQPATQGSKGLEGASVESHAPQLKHLKLQ